MNWKIVCHDDHMGIEGPDYRYHIRTWNLPAFVRYFTPLNGLYFSPYMSSLVGVGRVKTIQQTRKH